MNYFKMVDTFLETTRLKLLDERKIFISWTLKLIYYNLHMFCSIGNKICRVTTTYMIQRNVAE